MSRAAYAHMRTAGRYLREARLILAADPPRRSVEGVLARRIEDIMVRLDKAMGTHEDEERRRTRRA